MNALVLLSMNTCITIIGLLKSTEH